MKHLTNLRRVVAIAAGLLALTPRAWAEDTLKLAAAQRGDWESAAPELGRQAGIFKKHGIALDLVYTQDGGETEARVLSGGVDVGLPVGFMGVLHAYTRGAPVRVIGANTTGAASYWYVLATSPIKTIKDIVGRLIAYSTNGASSHYAVLDLIKQYRLKARLMSTGGVAATFNELTLGHVDVGWATPPFGIDAIEQGKIRVVARARDVATIRGKTASVLITNADTLEKRKDVLARFMQAYRETIEWMYSDPSALERYAELAGVSESFARRLRDEFFTKDMLSPDKIVGLKAVIKDAVTLRYIQTPLSGRQVAELIQIPAPARDALTVCQGARAGCPPIAPIVIP